jgi:hypothetical protein
MWISSSSFTQHDVLVGAGGVSGETIWSQQVTRQRIDETVNGVGQHGSVKSDSDGMQEGYGYWRSLATVEQ